jgi:hypothetical protein
LWTSASGYHVVSYFTFLLCRPTVYSSLRGPTSAAWFAGICADIFQCGYLSIVEWTPVQHNEPGKTSLLEGHLTRDHRRLAAIVSADVADYSRLMGVDDSGTLAPLETHRRELIDPKIVEYGGRILKTTGDGLLLEFPSVVDAVRCAVDVQRGMAERNAGFPPNNESTFKRYRETWYSATPAFFDLVEKHLAAGLRKAGIPEK